MRLKHSAKSACSPVGMTSKKQQYFATQKQPMSIKAHASFLSATVLVVAGTACSGVAMDDEEPSGGGGAGGPADGAGTGGNESGGSSGGSETGGATAGGGGADAGGGGGTGGATAGGGGADAGGGDGTGGAGGAGAGGAANPGGSGGGGFYPTCDAEHYDHDSSPTTACLPWSDCLEGTRVEVAGTATTDRVCAPCLGNSFSDDVNQAYCLGFQDCYSGQYVSTAGTPSSDRVCSSCPDGSFSDDDNEPACTPHDDCGHPWFIAEFGNEAEDNECGNGIRQFGSALSTHGSTVAVDAAGNVVVGGIILSLDPYVRVYTASGGLALNETFGGGNVADYVTDLTVDTNGDIFMVGELGSGSSPTSNGFVARWTQEGDSLWTTMFGPVSGGKFQSIAIDEGGAVYAVGSLYSTTISNDEAILRVYTPDGDSDWGTTFGSADSHDGASGVAVDALGNVVVVGTTSGVVQGATLGGDDAFIRLYDDLEAEFWTEQ